MPESTLSIAIVESELTDLDNLTELLSRKHEVAGFDSGQNFLLESHSDGFVPDVLIINPELSGQDGYSVCDQYLQLDGTEKTNIIFTSSRDTLQDKLWAYEVGASDYLVKPYEPQELERKILINQEQLRRNRQAQQREAAAVQTAMTALTTIGEMEVLLRFMERCLKLNTEQEVSKALIETLSEQGLICTLQVSFNHELITRGTQEPIPSLESELLTLLRDTGRLIEKGNRLIVNYPKASLLIRNLPAETDLRGRLRDNLAMMLDAVDAKLISLEGQQAHQHYQSSLQELLAEINVTLHQIEAEQQKIRAEELDVLDSLLPDMDRMAKHWELTDRQEDELQAYLQARVEKALNLHDMNDKPIRYLRSLGEDIKNLLVRKAR